MGIKIRHSIRIGLTMLLLIASVCVMYARQAAGISVETATRVLAPTTLTVQSGSNYIRIESKNLPATVTYVADTAFGPLPMALVMGDTLEVQMVFDTCHMAWRWSIEKDESDKIVEIKAHENAIIRVEPRMCTVTYSDTIAAECGGVEWYGQWYDKSGEYSVTLVNAEGCDSIHTLRLTVYQPQNTDTTAEVWDSIVWYGKTYKESGEYPITKQDEHECDFTYTLKLTVHTTAHDTYPETGCDSIMYNGKKYTESGVYADTIYDDSGNRTAMVLNFIVNHSNSGSETQEACGSYEWEGEIFKASGDYTKKFTNVAGCDSIATLHLTIHTSHGNTDTTAVAWDSIIWYGKTYKESGEYPITKQDEHECDYTHTLKLTVHTTTRDTISEHGCDSLIYEEKKYTEDGIYVLDTIPTFDENRIIHYLAVTLGTTLRDEKEEPDLCGRYIAPSGAVFTESGVYNDTTYQTDGCMSILTLRLQFQDDCTVYDTVYFCEGQNTKHLERWSPEHATYFIPYRYESPAEWDYMEGVIVSRETSRALVDLKRAEQNLYAHYVDSLTSVTSIVWSYRLHGASSYSIIQTTEEPQWIETGVVALTVRFVCGQMFTTDFTTDIESISDDRLSSGQKILQDGQIIIIRNGIKYNLLGTKIE
ncbi:MAG: hypothetical protein IJQ84_01065 [Paludibacteraceae bacterium]|nr:hypothetical protein [Paludibacteraceae bacterium]